MKKKINIIIFSGGRGSKSIVDELSSNNSLNISSVVNPFDDGKSTGDLRFLFNIHGPSDFRKVHQLFLNKHSKNYKFINFIYNYRFNHDVTNHEAITFLKNICFTKKYHISSKLKKNIEKISQIFIYKFLQYKNKNSKFTFKNCSLANIFYTGVFLINNNNINKSLKYIEKIFEIPDTVYSITNDNLYLCGVRESGQILKKEAEIVEFRSNIRIKNLFLLKKPLSFKKINRLSFDKKIKYLKANNINPKISNDVIKKINKADIIIYSPGTQHSSLLPTYMSNNFNKQISKSKALKIFITNIGADYETPNYTASEYILNAFKYINCGSKRYNINDFFDYNLINLNNNQNKKNYVRIDKNNLKKLNIQNITKDFEKKPYNGIHSGKKIIKVIFKIFNSI